MGAAASKKLRYSAEISSPMCGGKRLGGERAGGDDHIPVRNLSDLALPDGDERMIADLFGDQARRTRSRSTARAPPAATAVLLGTGDAEAPQPFHLLLEQSCGRCPRRLALKELEQISSAKPGRSGEPERTFGASSPRGSPRSHSAGQLPRGFAAGQVQLLPQ